MRSYQWWKKQKKRVQKKYTLWLGRYLSPKELRELFNRWMNYIRKGESEEQE